MYGCDRKVMSIALRSLLVAKVRGAMKSTDVDFMDDIWSIVCHSGH